MYLNIYFSLHVYLHTYISCYMYLNIYFSLHVTEHVFRYISPAARDSNIRYSVPGTGQLDAEQLQVQAATAEIRTAGVDLETAALNIESAGRSNGLSSWLSHDRSFYGSPNSEVYCSGDASSDNLSAAAIAATYSASVGQGEEDEEGDDDNGEELPLFSKRATMSHVDADGVEKVCISIHFSLHLILTSFSVKRCIILL